MAVETRRTALVDLSLDLIQRLLAHAHLAGPVHSISHKRDPAAARSGRKVGALSAPPRTFPHAGGLQADQYEHGLALTMPITATQALILRKG